MFKEFVWSLSLLVFFLAFSFAFILCSIFSYSVWCRTKGCLLMNSHRSRALVHVCWARFLRVSPIVLLTKWHASKGNKSREVHARMRWHHTRWSHSMRSMDHTSCNLHLLLVICFLFGTLCSFSHLLKV